jgi:hypothetical protein
MVEVVPHSKPYTNDQHPAPRRVHIPMRKPDINFVSFTGKDGNIWLNGAILFWGHDHTPGVKREYTLVMPIRQTGFADTVKFSGVVDFDLTIKGVVWGSAEDVMDFNNECRDVTVRALDGYRPFGRYGFTVKGGCLRITIIGEMLSHGKTVDAALGEHSDQSRRITLDTTLDLFSKNGRITYWIFNATDPVLKGSGPWKSVFDMPGFFRKPFAWLWIKLKKIFGV